MKPWGHDFWNKRDPEDLEWMSSNQRGGHEAGGRALPLVGPSWLNRPTSSSYICSHTPKTSRSTTKPYFHCRKLLYPRDPILGPFPELRRGASITEGFYINIIASPMMCEQFTSDLWVHSYLLDGFFSLFGSQYNVLPLSCGDLFDVIFFCGVFFETDELWVYDQVYL